MQAASRMKQESKYSYYEVKCLWTTWTLFSNKYILSVFKMLFIKKLFYSYH